MAISLRRSLICSRYLFSALRTASICSHHHTFSSFNFHFSQQSHTPPTTFHQFNFPRGFAKGRKQHIKVEEEDEEEDEDEYEEENEDEDEESGDLGANVKASAVSQMQAAIDSLSRELAKLRTGRASAGLLDHIMVEGTPLNRMAAVSVLDPKTLSVTPYDPNTLKELEKAIISSPLGLNPKADNQRLITPIPPLTKEHVQAVCKVVAKSSEDVKQRIRRARQKALDSIKKAAPKKKDKSKAASSISVDDAKRLEKEIEELTKKFSKTAEDMCKAKEKEIKEG